MDRIDRSGLSHQDRSELELKSISHGRIAAGQTPLVTRSAAALAVNAGHRIDLQLTVLRDRGGCCSVLHVSDHGHTGRGPRSSDDSQLGHQQKGHGCEQTDNEGVQRPHDQANPINTRDGFT